MEDNKLAKFQGGELDRIGNSISITNKLLYLKNDLKVLIIYFDFVDESLITYNLKCRGGFEIDNESINEADYEAALIKSKQKKYDVILITTMYNALELTSKIREDNINKNALIYILSQDRNFCAKDPKEFNIAGFMVKHVYYIDELIELMQRIRNKFNKQFPFNE